MHLRIGQQLLQIGRRIVAGRELHRMADAVAGRQLRQAQPVAEGIEPQRFGIDRHQRAQIQAVRQIVLVELDLHEGSIAQDRVN